MSEIDYDNLKHHPVSERIVTLLRNRIQTDDVLFFRTLVAYFFGTAASSMHCQIATPEGNKIPINVFAINLAPSGFGKGRATSVLEDEILGQFRNRFLTETFPLAVEDNLPKLANKRAVSKQCDPDEELARVEKEFANSGTMVYSFDSGTDVAAKQLRHKLLMAGAGALNLQIDEIGSNLLKNTDMLDVFLELYDGKIKPKLTKNTSDNVRNEEIKGLTPTNMLLFGTPSKLLNGGKQEEELITMLDTGFARRCLFGYVKANSTHSDMTPEKSLAQAKASGVDSTISDLADHFDALADIINIHKTLVMPEETSLLMFRYKLDCEKRAQNFKDHDESRKTEMESRFFKVLKLAGAYAFVDDSPEITPDHYKAAIKLAEESGTALGKLLNREKSYVKLAKYIADLDQEVTQADLVEDLPFYKGGVSARSEMMTLAIAYGYKNNIIIKKSFQDGIEFLRGESLKETDTNNIIVSYSQDFAQDYQMQTPSWDELHKLTQAQGMHWVNHELKNGYRNEENAIPGFNMAVIDVDGGVQLDMARELLKDYKYMLYTTKRSTADVNRFRILFPMSHVLELEAKDYKEFYDNIRAWLPFETDDSCSSRSKKWLSHAGHYEYHDGELLDVLPFIPKTSKNEERKERLKDQQAMDNLERWMINNTGDGNRNNMLMRFSMILVDAGFDFNQVLSKVTDLNNKLPDKLSEAEIMSTIMKSVAKALASQP